VAQQRKDRSAPSGASLARVLVPLDLSELSLGAVPFAYALAGPAGRVTLLHVIEPQTEPNPLYAHYSAGRTATPAEREALHAHLRERLQALVPEGAAAGGPETTIELVEEEDVPTAILRAAQRLGIDAICMASHGRTGLARVLLGSVAEGVLGAARWPLLIVPAARR